MGAAHTAQKRPPPLHFLCHPSFPLPPPCPRGCRVDPLRCTAAYHQFEEVKVMLKNIEDLEPKVQSQAEAAIVNKEMREALTKCEKILKELEKAREKAQGQQVLHVLRTLGWMVFGNLAPTAPPRAGTPSRTTNAFASRLLPSWFTLKFGGR